MISGKGFADRCRWVFDPRYPNRDGFHYSRASTGDWVFINGDYVYEFISLFPQIAFKQFTFVVHNSDQVFDMSKYTRLYPHANHIYAINSCLQHHKVTTIPIGFPDKVLGTLQGFKRPELDRTIEIYGNFTVATNTQKRLDCKTAVEGDPRVVFRENIGFDEYLMDLCRSKYVLCPEGTGIDTHRIYEALFCGATPVVLESNPLAFFYRKLPVCIVRDWRDPYFTPSSADEVNFDINSFL